MQKQAAVEFLTPAFSFWAGRWELFFFFNRDVADKLYILISQIRQNTEKLIVVASLPTAHCFIISVFLRFSCFSVIQSFISCSLSVGRIQETLKLNFEVVLAGFSASTSHQKLKFPV